MSMPRSALHLLTFALVAVGCTQTAAPQAAPSLRAVGAMSVVCAAPDSEGNLHGRPLDSCPDFYSEEDRRLFGLATQQETGEVALVELTKCEDGGRCLVGVRDLESTQPGINFLPVGAEPVAITSTPGGSASFVASAEPGREGIFALPTSCIGPRPEGEPLRDLRTWPACRLPAAPSSIDVIVDGQRTTACDGSDTSDTAAQARELSECYTDLGNELGAVGRRKLLVALPSRGQFVTIDAQHLLDSPPGRFEACPIESTTTLEVNLPNEPIAQVLPSDLQADDSCRPPRSVPRTQSFEPYPADIAIDADRAFVADRQAPVVHVLDLRNACQPREVEPLLTASYTRPGTTVLTRKVAVSPVTGSGKQFVYAVDDSAEATAGSVMVFDVSQGSTERTPLVRSGSPKIPSEPPDRIQFEHEVRDVEFVFQDLPVTDPDTDVAVEGIQCSADPKDKGPGSLYRPDGTSLGPSPSRLRGVFAALALESGFVNLIDIEDLDAECRRPSSVNASSESDIAGCHDDPFDAELESRGTATVTGELSCNIVEPHRARAARLFNTDLGGNAPSLRSFPQLRAKDGSSLAVDRSERGQLHPRLLGVNFSASDPEASNEGDAQVYVGNAHYTNQNGVTDRLELDPDSSQRNSVVLPFAEPRAYFTSQLNSLAFEGIVRFPKDSPYVVKTNAELSEEVAGWAGNQERYGVFEGGINGEFCAAGVEDTVLTRERLQELNPELTADELDELALHHADTVEVTRELPDSDDDYWDSATGKSCGEDYQTSNNSVRGRKLCQLFFGTTELPDAHRELRLMRALDDRLVVEPRGARSQFERDAVLDLLQCCFPGGIEFQVRAADEWVLHTGSQFDHKVRANPETLICERSCDPLDKYRDGRIFEITCDGEACAESDSGQVSVGPSDFTLDADSPSLPPVCGLTRHPVGGVQPGASGSACIHAGLTSRFAIYRGLAASERGMQFNWSTVGGFSPFSVDLYEELRKSLSAPQGLLFVKPINRLLVAEGGSTGITLIGLRAYDGSPGLSFGNAQ